MSERSVEKLCARCNRYQLIDRFGIDRQQRDGRNPCCKTCRAEVGAERRARLIIVSPPSGEKHCTLCGEIKPLTEFGRHRGRSDGLAAWCLDCKRFTNAAYLVEHGAERNRRRRNGQPVGRKPLPRPTLERLSIGQVPLQNGKSAWVDAEDWRRALEFLWHENGNGYAATKSVVGGKIRRLLLHRFVLGLSSDLECDHKDRDRLNCRRGNLRACTRAQNLLNKGPRRDNKLGLKGISFRRDRFVAEVHLNGKRQWCRSYGTIEEAARGYNEVAKKLFGEFAWLNPV